MAKLLTNKTGCLEAGQISREELALISWIELRIHGSCRRGQIELILICNISLRVSNKLLDIVAKSIFELTGYEIRTTKLHNPIQCRIGYR